MKRGLGLKTQIELWVKSKNEDVETGGDERSQRQKKIGQERKGSIFRRVIRFHLNNSNKARDYTIMTFTYRIVCLTAAVH